MILRRLRRRRARMAAELAVPDPAEVAELDPDEAEAQARQRSGLATPEDYLAEVCSLHQLVLLGDQRYVAQHLELVAGMLAHLWQRGVRNLAWEFTNTRVQADLDALVGAPTWSVEHAHDLFVDLLGVGLGYAEYVGVLRAAWELNRSLGDDDPPFRVIALGLPSYVEDPDVLDGRSGAETDLRNWWLGGHYRDVTAVHVANTLVNEIVRPRERALVYTDADRTTTRVLALEDGRPTISAGNLLFRWMGEGVQRVLFHGVLDDVAATERVEMLVEAAPDETDRFGIDLEFSTLGNVWLDTVRGVLDGGMPRLQLGDVADGYLYLGRREEWRRVSLADGFLRDDNLATAERRYRALDPRDEPYDRDELEEVRREGVRAIPRSWPPVPGAESDEDGDGNEDEDEDDAFDDVDGDASFDRDPAQHPDG